MPTNDKKNNESKKNANVEKLDEESRVDERTQSRSVEKDQKDIAAQEKVKDQELSSGPTNQEAKTAREDVRSSEQEQRDANLKNEDSKDDAHRKQLAADIEYRNAEENAKLGVIRDAQKAVEKDETTTLLNEVDKAAADGKRGANAALAEVQNAELSQTPQGDTAEFTPHRAPNAVELMTHAEGGSEESRSMGTRPHAASDGAQAAGIIEISNYYDITRGHALGQVQANPNSISVFNSFIGQYQVRSGEGLATPNRQPDVETMHAQWWQEGSEQTGYFVGKPLGVDGIVYRIPRNVAGMPVPHTVRYTDPTTEQQARESRVLSADFDNGLPEPIDTGLNSQVRPEASLTALPYNQDNYDGARATLGGFTGQAVKYPMTPVHDVPFEEARRSQAFLSGNMQAHVAMDKASGYVNKDEEAMAEGQLRQQKVKEGQSLGFDPKGRSESGNVQDKPIEEREPEEQADEEQRRSVRAQPPTEQGQREADPNPGFHKSPDGKSVTPNDKK